jgi:hypothetical protein
VYHADRLREGDELSFELLDLKTVLMPKQWFFKKLDPDCDLMVPELRNLLLPCILKYRALVLLNHVGPLRRLRWHSYLIGCRRGVQILKDYANSASLTAKEVKKLIENGHYNRNFNAGNVDTDMLGQFANSIDSFDLEIISMHKEGDGAQQLALFQRPAEKVLREFMSDIRFAGCQHCAFK